MKTYVVLMLLVPNLWAPAHKEIMRFNDMAACEQAKAKIEKLMQDQFHKYVCVDGVILP